MEVVHAATADRAPHSVPHTQEMFEAVPSGGTDPEIEGVEVVRWPALTRAPAGVLGADGYLLGAPANMSGALRHYSGEYPLSRLGAS